MKEKILNTILKNMPEGYELLYSTISGSKLYGTHNENSDTDVKFIFKPSLEDCVLGVASRNLNMNTSGDTESNSKDDIDCQGWSIQFFLDLLRKGDTNAIDVLYSVTNEDCLVYYPNFTKYHYSMNKIFYNPLDYFDLSNMRGLLGYIVSQSDKYGLKGSRFNKLNEVYIVTLDEIEKLPQNRGFDSYLDEIKKLPQNRGFDSYIDYKLEKIYKTILEKCGDSTFCKFEVCQDGREAIRLGGKVHLLDISINEFIRRLESELGRYGERSKKALDGSDWKALSHAYRGIVQILELIDTKNLTFPLKDANLLKEIKNGNLSMEKTNILISEGLQTVKIKLDSIQNKTKVDHKLINQTILNLYGV